MLHVIGRKCHYGDLDIFKRIGVFFVQATRSVEVPTEAGSSEESLRNIINLFWFFRRLINESYEAISELERLHIENMKKKARKLQGHEDVKSICDNFKVNTYVKLPQVHMKGTSNVHIASPPPFSQFARVADLFSNLSL
ncbi:unnamed protein product [Mucor hiemalis]